MGGCGVGRGWARRGRGPPPTLGLSWRRGAGREGARGGAALTAVVCAAPLQFGDLPLHEAAAGGNEQCVRLLLACASNAGDAAAVERHLTQNPGWVHEKGRVRSARVG